jgi:hypothetical protein
VTRTEVRQLILRGAFASGAMFSLPHCTHKTRSSIRASQMWLVPGIDSFTPSLLHQVARWWAVALCCPPSAQKLSAWVAAWPRLYQGAACCPLLSSGRHGMAMSSRPSASQVRHGRAFWTSVCLCSGPYGTCRVETGWREQRVPRSPRAGNVRLGIGSKLELQPDFPVFNWRHTQAWLEQTAKAKTASRNLAGATAAEPPAAAGGMLASRTIPKASSDGLHGISINGAAAAPTPAGCPNSFESRLWPDFQVRLSRNPMVPSNSAVFGRALLMFWIYYFHTLHTFHTLPPDASSFVHMLFLPAPARRPRSGPAARPRRHQGPGGDA